MLKKLYNKYYVPINNVIYKAFPWSVVIYAHRRYPFGWLWLINAYRKAEDTGVDTILGFPKDKAVEFFSACAGRAHDESEQYRCVYGTCTVIWHPKMGNRGGMGRPGCPCDDMDDPRDLKRGPIRAKA